MKPESPRKDCVAPDRHIGCRNTCAKWPIYTGALRDFNYKVFRAKADDAMFASFVRGKDSRALSGSIAKFAHAKQEEAYEKMHRIL